MCEVILFIANEIGVEGARMLGEGLKRNSGLTRLDVSREQCPSEK